MTLDSEQRSAQQDNSNGRTKADDRSVHYSTARHANYVEASPDLLRWRADVLLDEMMLGAVDVSAADDEYTAPPHTNGVVEGSEQDPYDSQGYVAQGYSDEDARSRDGYGPDRHSDDWYAQEADEYSFRAPNVRDEYAGNAYRETGPGYAEPYPDAHSGGADDSARVNQTRVDESPGHYGAGREHGHIQDEHTQDSYAQQSYAQHDYTEEYTEENYAQDSAPAAIDANRHDDPPREARSREQLEQYRYEQYNSDDRYSTDRYTGGDVDYYAEDPGVQRRDREGASGAPPRGDSFYGGDFEEESGPFEDESGPNGKPDDEMGRESPHAPRSSYPSRADSHTEDRRLSRSVQDDALPPRNRFEDAGSSENPRSFPNVAPWRQGEQDLPPRDARPLEDVRSSPEPAASTDTTPRADRLYSVEQRYEQFRRKQQSNIRPMPAKHPEPEQPPRPPRASTSPPTSAPTSSGSTSAGPTSPDPSSVDSGPGARGNAGNPTGAHSADAGPPEEDEQTRWASTPEKWLRQDFSDEDDAALMNGAASHESAQAANEPDPAVRQDQAGFVNAMSVMSNKRRSNLLPRMSTLDVDTLNREISELHGELAELLPVGHEVNERARHLLDKAYSILQSDPMRSAEVEYYMQQVRTIVQRQRQARDWSALYRDRLRVYLLSWASLAGLILAARYVFQMQTEAFLVTSMGLESGGFILRHWSAFWGAGMAGALGGALGALYTMHQYLRQEQGLFDRKYGLRGLMLPIIGLIVGWFGYAAFAAVYALFQINPAAGLLSGSLPAVFAFTFGFSQESIYGTRD